MPRTLHPRADCIRKIGHQSRRCISNTHTRLFPPTEEGKEDEDEDSTAPPGSFLSTRSEIDAYLRAQNDEYLAKLKQHLKYISQPAESINAILTNLSRRAAHIRPPKSGFQSERNTIPPYTVATWRKSTETISPVTQALLDQIDRLVKNVEDLESEPYRADVTASERERMNRKVAQWTEHEKEMAFLSAGFETTGMEARFNRGVEQLENHIVAMLAAREEQVAERAAAKRRVEPASDNSANTTASAASSPSDESATNYRPMSASNAPGVPPKAAGWGASPTKVEERGRLNIRMSNPFKSAEPASASSAQDALDALKKKLDAEFETAPSPTQKYTTSEPTKAVESKVEAELPEVKAEPKVRTLADLQRFLGASQQ